MIQTIDLLPGITLRCFPEDRFKQESLSLCFVRPMCRQEVALNALLPAVLLRGCESAPNLQAITQRLDDLYGAAVGSVLRRIGDIQVTGIACSFIKEKYLLSGDEIFTPMLTFFRELLLCPLVENGAFREDIVESEKRNLLSAIAAQRNDKRVYADSRMFQVMCKGDSFGIPQWGDKEDVEAITPESLYYHHGMLLEESPIEIFYVGSSDPHILAGRLRDMLKDLPRNPHKIPTQTPFRDLGGCEETEEMDVAQGKLSMGFVTPVTLRDEGFVPTQIFNTIFGGGMISKLFMNIREKQSLCYDIHSTYHGSKGILTVSAGIDADMDQTVREEVLKQLRACQQGDFTEEELTAAKEAILTQLNSTHDSPGAIEGYYATSALSGLPLSPEDYIRAVEQATGENVANAAKQVTLHTVYFLRGAM